MLKSIQYPHWLLVVPLLLLAAGLGVHGLNIDTLWYDEAGSLYYAGATPPYGPSSLADTWARLARGDFDTNPPSYYLLLTLWGQLVGWTPLAARALSLLLGLLTIAALYRLGRDVGGPLAGWGAAITLGLSAYFVVYLHEVRAYMLMALCTTITLLAYWRLMHRSRASMGLSATFVLGLAGMSYTHYMTVPVIFAIGLYHLLFAPKNRRWLYVTGLAVAAGLCFLPWAAVAVTAAGRIVGDTTFEFYSKPPITLTLDLITNFSNGSPLLLAVFGWYALYRWRSTGGRFALTLLLGGLGATILLNELFRFVASTRYLLALFPPLALVVGLGTATLHRLKLRPMIMLGIWGLAGIVITLYPVERQSTQEDWLIYLNWDKVSATLRSWVQPGDTIIYYLPQPVPAWVHAPVAAYYLYDLPARVEPYPPFAYPPPDIPEESSRLYLVESLLDKPPAAYADEANALLSDQTNVYVAYNPLHRPGPFTQSSFETALAERGFILCQSPIAQPDLYLGLYANINTSEAAHRLQFEQNITLDLLTPVSTSTHDRLRVLLRWHLGDNVPRGTYSLGLHLEDANGNFISSVDAGLPVENESCQQMIVETAGLEPGQYQLRAVVYDWQTEVRLPATTSDQPTPDTRPLLATFTLE